MFDNTIDLQGSVPAVSLTDTDNGKSIRRYNAGGGNFYELVVGNQETGENKGLITDRHVVQTSYLFTDPASGKPVRTSASILMSYPRHTDIGHTMLQALLIATISFFTGTLDSTQVNALNASTARKFNGEL